MDEDIEIGRSWEAIATAVDWVICQNKGVGTVYIFIADAAPDANSTSGFALSNDDKGFAHDQVGGRNVYARTNSGSTFLAVDAG